MAFEKKTRNGATKQHGATKKGKKSLFATKLIAKKRPKALKKVGKGKSSAKSSTTTPSSNSEKSTSSIKKGLRQFEESKENM